MIAAQVCGCSGLRYATGDFFLGGLSAPNDPNAENIAFAIGHGDDTIRRDLKSTGNSLVNDGPNVRFGKLCAGGGRIKQQESRCER